MPNVDQSAAPGGGSGLTLMSKRHAKYLSRFLKLMPESTSSFDTSRMTLAFFVLSGLDVMGSEEAATAVLNDSTTRDKCRKWIRSLYVHDKEAGVAGFHGGTFVKVGEKNLIIWM